MSTPSEAMMKLVRANPAPNPYAGVAAALGISENYVRLIAKGGKKAAIPGPQLWINIKRALDGNK